MIRVFPLFPGSLYGSIGGNHHQLQIRHMSTAAPTPSISNIPSYILRVSLTVRCQTDHSLYIANVMQVITSLDV